MEYLLNDRNDFYDTNFLTRLEHQVKILKRLINLQVAKVMTDRSNVGFKDKDGSQNITSFDTYKEASASYTAKIDSI